MYFFYLINLIFRQQKKRLSYLGFWKTVNLFIFFWHGCQHQHRFAQHCHKILIISLVMFHPRRERVHYWRPQQSFWSYQLTRKQIGFWRVVSTGFGRALRFDRRSAYWKTCWCVYWDVGFATGRPHANISTYPRSTKTKEDFSWLLWEQLWCSEFWLSTHDAW